MQLSQAQLTYQISPIILTGGIAGTQSGGMLPFLALTNPEAFDPDLLNGNQDFALDDAFAIFQPAVGGSLVEETIAKYPFANLSVAANAIIREPIHISMIMLTPMKTEQSWEYKLAIMTGLKQTLDNHNNAGGTYTVLTPGYYYQNMLMTGLTDVSTSQSPLPQNAWRWDFEKPLVSLDDVQGAMNNLFSQITNGVPSDGITTGTPTAAGAAPSTTNVGQATAPNIPSTPPINYDPTTGITIPNAGAA
jgi:hypothetical protein